MASIVSITSLSSSSDSTSYSGAGPFFATDGDLHFALVTTTGTASAGSLTDSSGITYTQVASIVRDGSADRSYLFVADRQAVGSETCNLTFSCSDDAATGCYISVMAARGMNAGVAGLSAIRQYAVIENMSAGRPAVVFSTSANSANPLVALVSNSSNPGGVGVPSGFTSNTNSGYSSPTTGHCVSSKNSGFASSTVTWGISGSAYCAIAVEFAISGATQTATASGFSSAEFGIPAASILSEATGFSSTGFGDASFAQLVCEAAGISSSEFGLPSVAVVASAAGIDSAPAFGAPKASLIVAAESFLPGQIGLPAARLQSLANGISSVEFGLPGATVIAFEQGFSPSLFGAVIAKVLATPKNRFAYSRAYRLGDGAMVLSRISPHTKH